MLSLLRDSCRIASRRVRYVNGSVHVRSVSSVNLPTPLLRQSQRPVPAPCISSFTGIISLAKFSTSLRRLSDDLPPTSFSDPERPGLYYHLFEPPTSVSSTSPVFAISFLPGAPLVAESKTVLGWLPAQTFGGDGEAGLNDFRQNRERLAILLILLWLNGSEISFISEHTP